MPYQLIIHHDDGRQEVAASGTQADVYKAMTDSTIDPDHAIWEMVWVEPGAQVNGIQYNSQMGKVRRDNGETQADRNVRDNDI